MLCLVHLGDQLFWQALPIHLHRIPICRTSTADGHVRQRLSRLVSLARQSRDDACRCIVLVQRRAELLPRLSELLLQRESLQHNRIPLVLESAQKRWYRREVWRAGCDDSRRLELDQVVDRELLPSDGVGVVFGDVRLD